MMINKEETAKELSEALSGLLKAVELFDEIQYHKIPFENSWTAGQVVAHLSLSNNGFLEVLNAKVADTARAIDELKPQLKAIFLNFGNKMKSPDFILPKLKAYDQETQRSEIGKTKEAFLKAINDLDLSKTCVSFPLPGLGNLTRLEAIYFVIYHTERHTNQLKEIYRFLKEA